MSKDELNKLIGKMAKRDLVKLIMVMTQYNNAAEQVLLEFCQKNTLIEDKDFVAGKQIENHWYNAYQIIDDANTYGGCSEEDEDEACDELNNIVNLVKIHSITWESRKLIVDAMLKQFYTDNSGFTDILVESIMEICQSQDEQEYLADALSKGSTSYYKGVAASIYREIGKDDQYLKIKKKI